MLRRGSIASLGWLAARLMLHQHHSCAGADGGAERSWSASLGSRECPLDISVLWTAEVDSPVYSTPVILPSFGDGRKQVRSVHTHQLGFGKLPFSVDYPRLHLNPSCRCISSLLHREPEQQGRWTDYLVGPIGSNSTVPISDWPVTYSSRSSHDFCGQYKAHHFPGTSGWCWQQRNTLTGAQTL